MLKRELVLGYCPQGNGSSIAPFDRVFAKSQNIMDSIEGVDAVVFWGGTDIHPSLYGEKPHRLNQQQGDEPIWRDIFEWRAMLYCKANRIPMIGVCRGAQLMCAFVGGKLIQDVTGHVGGSGYHRVMTDQGENFEVTSCHHQMMYPYDVEHVLKAWAVPRKSMHYQGEGGRSINVMEDRLEPEIVLFPQVKGLAIQGHPEWAVNSEFADYCNELISTELLQLYEVAAF